MPVCSWRLVFVAPQHSLWGYLARSALLPLCGPPVCYWAAAAALYCSLLGFSRAALLTASVGHVGFGALLRFAWLCSSWVSPRVQPVRLYAFGLLRHYSVEVAFSPLFPLVSFRRCMAPCVCPRGASATLSAFLPCRRSMRLFLLCST